MRRSSLIAGVALTSLLAFSVPPCVGLDAYAANSFTHSDFVETEQPELTQETKDLISAYQKDPSEENYLALRDMVIANYDAVLDRKEQKLVELKVETAGKPGGDETVAEMEDIVQDMYATYWNRINSSMLRFTDSRLLKWKTADAANFDFIPVMGASESVYVSRTPVTNAQYAEYVQATGAAAPQGWDGGEYPAGEGDFPVNYVSYDDAQAYCVWLTGKDGANAYRLPNESEWELAAGHMPKDADFNCGVTDGRVSVYEYDGVTRGAHGAIDFWGNVWEWTSTLRASEDGTNVRAVKGGAWDSERTDCRTEYRGEGRDSSQAYEDTGFRVIQVLGGEEPAQKVELATLDAPIVTARSAGSDGIELSWQAVDGATAYQLFEYFEDTGLVQMLDCVQGTSTVISGLEPGSEHSYIVQPIAYVEIADDVSAEYRVRAACGMEGESVSGNVADGPIGDATGDGGATPDPDVEGSDSDVSSTLELVSAGGLNCWLYTPADAEGDMPLVVYLHGVTGKGDDPNALLTSDDFASWLSEGEFGDVRARILMPQLPFGCKDWTSAQDAVLDAIAQIEERGGVDAGNISLTGFSMGGTGAWSIAAANPDLFSRVAPVAGGVRAKRTALEALGAMPVWAFVGADDQVVSPQSAMSFMNRLSEGNDQAKLTVFDGAGHTDVPALAYRGEGLDLIGWLIAGE